MKERNRFRQQMLPLAIGMLLATGATMAQAQSVQAPPASTTRTTTAPVDTDGAGQNTPTQRQRQSDPTELEGVVVSGIRESLESAEAKKRYAPQIVDSIVAQSIGKLPDTNAADALGRITGVQVAQDDGEGSGIAIRGLTQIETQLNGNTVFTASGSRTLNFEDIPAELMAGIDVYKTPTADQVEGGIGGIIDLRTHRPFDFDGFKAAGSAGVTYADMASRSKPKISGLISNTWDTDAGKIGALLAVSYQVRPYAGKSTGLNPTDTLTGEVDANGDGTVTDDDVLTYPPGIYYEYSHGDRRRVGINGSLQWQATDNLELYMDSYFASFKSTGNYNSVYVDSSVGSELDISNLYEGTSTLEDFTTFPGTSDMMSGTFGNANLVPQSFSQDFRNKTYNFSLGEKWSNGTWTVNSNVHYARGTHEFSFNELDLHAKAPRFSMDVGPRKPMIGYEGIDLSNPDNFDYAAIYWEHTRNTGKLRSFSTDAAWETGNDYVHTLKFGYRYAKRTATNDANSRYVDSVDSGTDYFGQPVSSIPGLVANRPTAIGEAATPDANQLRDVADIFGKFNLGPVPGSDPLQAYDLGERTDAVYLSAMFGTYGDVPIDGNIGVRAVRTRDSMNGVLSTDDGYAPLNKRSTYNNLLPTLNMTLHLTDSLQWRIAASETMARPSFSQLSPSVFLNGLQHTGSSGNPDLKPMKAVGFDTSLAWYFQKGGYLFGDVFHKKIKSSIAYTESVETFNGQDYRIQKPTNANEGKLSGIELGYQQFFRNLPGWLGGFGVQANYTYVDSSINGIVPEFQTSLPDLSKNSYNLMLLYDSDRFWGRIAYNWRSSYFLLTRASALGTVPVYKKAYGILDASIGYHFSPHVAVSLDGVNLTNTKQSSYYLRQSLPNELLWNDRRVEATLRVTF